MSNETNEVGDVEAGMEVGLYLTPEDVKDLPDDLLKQLSFGDSEKKDFLILEILEELGGVAILDKILISIYRKTGEIERRNKLTSRLYRLCNRKLVFAIPEKKGVYSLKPMKIDDGQTKFFNEEDQT